MGGRRRGSVMATAFVIVFAAAVVPASGLASEPHGAPRGEGKRGPRVIIDTDLSRWRDDASTIGLANVLHQRGKMRILGIVSDVPNTVAVAAIDAIDTAYGHGDIPLGAVAGSEAGNVQHG